MHALSTVDAFTHPLLAAAGCPPTGNGSPIILQQLKRALTACQELEFGAYSREWLSIVQRLSQDVALDPRKPSISPTQSELTCQPWGRLHECLEARSRVKNQSVKHLDALFAHWILCAAEGHRPLNEAGLQGLRTCYLALSGKRTLHREWTLLASPVIIVHAELACLLPELTHPPVRALGTLVLELLDKPMPTPAGISKPDERLQDQALELTYEDMLATPPSSTAQRAVDLEASGTVASIESETVQAAFNRGDLVIGWHVKRASNSTRNDRLALGSWTSLPIEETCRISSRLPSLLSQPDSPWSRAAVIVVSSLLTSTPPHVLLHAKIHCDEDLNIDLAGQRFTWTIDLLLGASRSTLERSSQVAIPFPQALKDALSRLVGDRSFSELRYFSDLFRVEPDSAAWTALIRQSHDLLRELSEPALQAFPGRWSKSVSRVYRDTVGSDLLSSICSLDLALVPQAALYYFHPSERDINDAVAKVFERLGLGPAAVSSNPSLDRPIASEDQLRTGYKKMEDQAVALHADILNKKTDLRLSIAALNELTRLTAATCVFLIGGRGSKVEEFTCGALFCAKDVWWLEDKKVEHENSSRIVPKPQRLQFWIERWSLARQSVAERLCKYLRRDRADRWRELASGLLRFDSPAFEILTLQPEKVYRSPVTATDIEVVSQRYFCAGKNFMRHVLISYWGIHPNDSHLLRLITGHATAGLALPAAGAMYTPEAATRAAGVALEALLQPWMPPVDMRFAAHANHPFVALPGRRILKVHGAYRHHIEKWDAPVFSRWHLAAVRIVECVRDLLLAGHGPADPFALLWLHLVAFDALHETLDLKTVFSNPANSFELGAVGWVIKLKRLNSAHQFIAPAQIPTALLLSRLSVTDLTTTDYSAVVSAAAEWLAKATPDFWSGQVEAVDEALLASVRLWSDWCLPPAVQLCYAAESHAPVLDSLSNSALYGLKIQSNSEAKPFLHRRDKGSTDHFNSLYKVINRLGSNRHQLGEQKKRAQLFDRWVKFSAIDTCRELAATLVRVIGVNILRMRAGKKSVIEWSSQATYFSVLRPFLTPLRDEDAEEFDTCDWQEFSSALLTFATGEEKQTVTATEAAHWMLGCLRELGYPVPSREELAHVRRYPVASATTATAAITDEEVRSAIAMLSALSNTPLHKARLRIAMRLLSNHPLRWGEMAALACRNLASGRLLCITSTGFAHLKSHAARRLLKLTPELFQDLKSISQQIEDISTHGTTEDILFGSKPLPDGTVIQDSAWIRDAITWAVQACSHNTNFRIHSFRANYVSRMLLPEWVRTVSKPEQFRTGPKATNDLFAYEASRAWITDEARLAAGHASIRTTLTYYFHAWLPTRSLALRASLARHRPPESQNAKGGTSAAALAKARSRHLAYRTDPWEYVQHKLPKTAPDTRDSTLPCSRSSSTDSAQGSTSHVTPSATAQQHPHVFAETRTVSRSHQLLEVTYLGLRMLGKDEAIAANLLKDLSSSALQALESKLKRSSFRSETLRGRIKGDISGRALKADVSLLLSKAAVQTSDALSLMPTDTLLTLLHLLLPKHEVVNWEDELTLIGPWLTKSNISIEVVSDIKRVDPEINIRLSRVPGVVIGSPAHDVGLLPRIFAQPREQSLRNLVIKARWTTMLRVLCCSWISLRFEEP